MTTETPTPSTQPAAGQPATARPSLLYRLAAHRTRPYPLHVVPWFAAFLAVAAVVLGHTALIPHVIGVSVWAAALMWSWDVLGRRRAGSARLALTVNAITLTVVTYLVGRSFAEHRA